MFLLETDVIAVFLKALRTPVGNRYFLGPQGQWVKMPAAKTDGLRLIPGPHVTDFDLHLHARHICAHIHADTNDLRR